MKRKASAIWHGTGLEGSGVLSTQSGVLIDQPYSASLRFKNEDGQQGTNPEELIAAAHAGCFAMALSFQLTNAGFTPGELSCKATLQMDKGESGWDINSIHLDMESTVPEITEAKFLELAQDAKENCPVSKLLKCDITLDAKLI